MKKRNSSRSGTKRSSRKPDYVVDNPYSSELNMLDHVNILPQLDRSAGQLTAKLNGVASLPVAMDAAMIAHHASDAKDSMCWTAEHQIIDDSRQVKLNQQVNQSDAMLEMTAVAHANDEHDLNTSPNSDTLTDERIRLAEHKEYDQKLGEQSIQTSDIADESVSSEKLADFCVISSKLAPEAVQSDHISGLSIHSQHIADQSIRPYHLHQAAIEREAIAYGAVDSIRLALESVSTVHIQNDAITERTIQSQSICSRHIADQAIISEHIEPNSIADYHLQPEAVNTESLQDGAVSSDKLAYGAVESVHIQEDVIQTAHLEDQAVTADKLAKDSVGSEHVRAGSIFTKHLGFAPVRTLSERSAAMQFGSVPFVFEREDQDALEINVLFANSYEKADYTFVCTSNLYGTSAVIKEQYFDGVVVQLIRDLKCVEQAGFQSKRSGALSWIAVG